MQNPNLASILFQGQRLPQASFWCREPTSRILSKSLKYQCELVPKEVKRNWISKTAINKTKTHLVLNLELTIAPFQNSPLLWQFDHFLIKTSFEMHQASLRLSCIIFSVSNKWGASEQPIVGTILKWQNDVKISDFCRQGMSWGNPFSIAIFMCWNFVAIAQMMYAKQDTLYERKFAKNLSELLTPSHKELGLPWRLVSFERNCLKSDIAYSLPTMWSSWTEHKVFKTDRFKIWVKILLLHTSQVSVSYVLFRHSSARPPTVFLFWCQLM